MLSTLTRRFKVKVRDYLFRDHVFKIHTTDGVLPYFRGDVLGKRLWRDNDFEDADRAVVRRLCKNCSVFIDGGANLGVYSLLAARACPPGAKIFAFEPSPLEYQKLQLTIGWNDAHTIIPCPIALSDSIGTTSFFQSLDGRGALNRIDRPGDTRTRYEKVEIERTTLDAFLQERGVDHADFIKLDVEGHELPVLRGALETIRAARPILLIEMADKRQSDSSTPSLVWDFLEGEGYVWHTVDKAADRLVPLTRPARFPSVNLYAVPREKGEPGA